MQIDTDLKIRLLENDLEIKEEKIQLLTETLAGSKEELILLTNRLNDQFQERERLEVSSNSRMEDELNRMTSEHQRDICFFERTISKLKDENMKEIGTLNEKIELKTQKVKKFKKTIKSLEKVIHQLDEQLEQSNHLAIENEELKDKISSLSEK